MTVSQLIAQLQECNPEAQVFTVYMPDDDGDLIVCKVSGVTPRGTLNATEDCISLDIED